jgi:hypothetical protein
MGLLWSFSIGRPADKNDRLEAYPTLLSVASSDVPGAFCPDRHRRGSIKVSFSCFYPVAKAAEDDGFNRLECHKVNDLEHITGHGLSFRSVRQSSKPSSLSC